MDENTAKIQMPICPICQQKMRVALYKGYYDQFKYWTCSCSEDKLPATDPDDIQFGSFA